MTTSHFRQLEIESEVLADGRTRLAGREIAITWELPAAPPKKARAPKKPKTALTPSALPPGRVWSLAVDGRLVVRLNVRTKNEANMASPHTPFLLSSYRKKIRKDVAFQLLGVPVPSLPVDVLLTRFGAGHLDAHDGLPNSQKTVVDEPARWLRLPVNKRGHADDSDARVSWRYENAKCPAGQGWVEVTFTPRKAVGQ